MYTSCFARYKESDGISIAVSPPKWYTGIVYPPLFPSWEIVRDFKKGGDKDKYIEIYQASVLNKLDPAKVYQDLVGKTLLCWCARGAFCHRRLVADWIRENIGISVPER